MIHEGPLLEYAGRDLAYLQWAAAARHWLVLVLAAEVFLPHPGVGGSSPCSRSSLVAALRRARADRDARRRRCASCSCRGCSRSARRSRCSGIVALAGGDDVSGDARLDARRRSGSSSSSCGAARSPSALVTAQALLLARRGAARADAAPATLVAGASRSAARVALAALLSSSSSRTREPRPVRRRRTARSCAAARGRARARADLARAATRARLAHAERAVLALVAFGIVDRRDAAGDALPGARDRRWSRTALALAALELPGGLPLVIEFGVAFDLTAGRARRGRLPRADLRRVRRRRHRRLRSLRD